MLSGTRPMPRFNVRLLLLKGASRDACSNVWLLPLLLKGDSRSACFNVWQLLLLLLLLKGASRGTRQLSKVMRKPCRAVWAYALCTTAHSALALAHPHLCVCVCASLAWHTWALPANEVETSKYIHPNYVWACVRWQMYLWPCTCHRHACAPALSSLAQTVRGFVRRL